MQCGIGKASLDSTFFSKFKLVKEESFLKDIRISSRLWSHERKNLKFMRIRVSKLIKNEITIAKTLTFGFSLFYFEENRRELSERDIRL